MKQLIKVLLVLGLILSLNACDALFTFNAFNGLEKLGVLPTIEDAATMTTDEYAKKAESPTFFEALADPVNAPILEVVLDTLHDTYTDPATPPAEVQQAALVYAAVQMETSGAAEIVNNAVSMFGDPTVFTGIGPAPTPEDLKSLVDQLIPADVQSDPVALNKMIEALIAANAAYVAYGNAITNPPAPIPENVNPGEVAMNAVLCAVIASITPSSGTLGDALYAILNDVPLGGTTFTFTEPGLDSGYLGNILGQAGIVLPQ